MIDSTITQTHKLIWILSHKIYAHAKCTCPVYFEVLIFYKSSIQPKVTRNYLLSSDIASTSNNKRSNRFRQKWMRLQNSIPIILLQLMHENKRKEKTYNGQQERKCLVETSAEIVYDYQPLTIPILNIQLLFVPNLSLTHTVCF